MLDGDSVHLSGASCVAISRLTPSGRDLLHCSLELHLGSSLYGRSIPRIRKKFITKCATPQRLRSGSQLVTMIAEWLQQLVVI